jgi:hypothetical protein
VTNTPYDAYEAWACEMNADFPRWIKGSHERWASLPLDEVAVEVEAKFKDYGRRLVGYIRTARATINLPDHIRQQIAELGPVSEREIVDVFRAVGLEPEVTENGDTLWTEEQIDELGRRYGFRN